MGSIRRNRTEYGSAQAGQAPPRPGFLMTRPPRNSGDQAETSFSTRLSTSRPFPAEPTD